MALRIGGATPQATPVRPAPSGQYGAGSNYLDQASRQEALTGQRLQNVGAVQRIQANQMSMQDHKMSREMAVMSGYLDIINRGGTKEMAESFKNKYGFDKDIVFDMQKEPGEEAAPVTMDIRDPKSGDMMRITAAPYAFQEGGPVYNWLKMGSVNPKAAWDPGASSALAAAGVSMKIIPAKGGKEASKSGFGKLIEERDQFEPGSQEWAFYNKKIEKEMSMKAGGEGEMSPSQQINQMKLDILRRYQKDPNAINPQELKIAGMDDDMFSEAARIYLESLRAMSPGERRKLTQKDYVREIGNIARGLERTFNKPGTTSGAPSGEADMVFNSQTGRLEPARQQ